MRHQNRSGASNQVSDRIVERNDESLTKESKANAKSKWVGGGEGMPSKTMRLEPGTAVGRYLKTHFVPQSDDEAKTPEQIESESAKRVLLTLREAKLMAIECDRDQWDFSVEINELSELGVPRHVLRTLVCRQLVEHRREVTINSGDNRIFEPASEIVLSNGSCFVLTNTGIKQADKLASEEAGLEDPATDSNSKNDLIPVWNPDSRELKLGELLIKRFKWPARNQERVLRAFQAQNWQHTIASPFSDNEKICPQTQLHDTIKCLNRNQVTKAIRFHGDGTGHGVYWEIVSKYLPKSINRG